MADQPCDLSQDLSSFNCSNPYPQCRSPGGFLFNSLSVIASGVARCLNDTRLFDGASLTQEACVAFVGSDTPTAYSLTEIWARLTTWKFPLFQLVFIFPRAPLSFGSEAFVLIHLLGDPIGTLSNLLLKVGSCQDRADWWRKELQKIVDSEEPGVPCLNEDKHWKQLVNIIDAYDEWGRDIGDQAQDALLGAIAPNSGHSPEQKHQFLDICFETAKALAADRATKFLPIFVAQAIFIGTIGMAFGRTPVASSGPAPFTFINIEAHSIAFSALYFWVLPTVTIGSVIGVSQTEAAIPRILRRFQEEVNMKLPELNVKFPLDPFMNKGQRKLSGGLYSWNPRKVRANILAQMPAPAFPDGLVARAWHLIKRISLPGAGSIVLPFLNMVLCLLTATFISYRVPPEGWGCRSISESLIVAVWTISWLLNYAPWLLSKLRNPAPLPLRKPLDRLPQPLRKLVDRVHLLLRKLLDRLPLDSPQAEYCFVYGKDVIAMILTLGGVVATQVGVLNRCSCYTLGDRTGLALPEIPSVSSVLFAGITLEYPLEAFACIALQLIAIPLLIAVPYRNAMRVFLQRDDDASNARLWYAMRDLFGRRRPGHDQNRAPTLDPNDQRGAAVAYPMHGLQRTGTAASDASLAHHVRQDSNTSQDPLLQEPLDAYISAQRSGTQDPAVKLTQRGSWDRSQD